MVVGALRWAAVWSEVKGEGRLDLIPSERPVNRPGGESPDTNSPVDCSCLASARGPCPGHERTTVARRSVPALTSVVWCPAKPTWRQRSKGFNVGHTFASIVGCPTSATWMRSAWYCESGTPAIKKDD